MEGAREALTHVGHYVQDLRSVDGLLKPSDEATGGSVLDVEMD